MCVFPSPMQQKERERDHAMPDMLKQSANRAWMHACMAIPERVHGISYRVAPIINDTHAYNDHTSYFYYDVQDEQGTYRTTIRQRYSASPPFYLTFPRRPNQEPRRAYIPLEILDQYL